MQAATTTTRPSLTGQDWANAIAHATDSNAYIQIVASFPGHVDEDLLRQAVAYTIQVFPVLGCRFDDSGETPVWTRVHDADMHKWVQAERTTANDSAIERFLADAGAPLEQMIAVKLLLTGEESILCIRIDHACCDGGGAKAYLKFLCDVYSSLAGYSAEPLTAYNSGDRSVKQVFSACNISAAREAYRPEKNQPQPTVTLPFCKQRGNQMRFARRCIPHHEWRSAAGITINDRIVAAYVRCLQKHAITDDNRLPDRLAVNVTIDLRRYLQPNDAPAICNLSGMETVSIPIADEGYLATVHKVHNEMEGVKRNQPGLHSAASMEFLTGMPYRKARDFLLQASEKQVRSGVSTPILSNLGQIDEVKLADMRATDVNIIVPAFHAPAFMLGCNSYGNQLTLTIGYYCGERAETDIQAFLDDIAAELCQQE